MNDKVTIIDKFLSYPDLVNLRDVLYYREDFAYHIHRCVAYADDVKHNWNWYGTHMFYSKMKPASNFFSMIDELFIEKMQAKLGLHTYYRIKCNFYPWTETLKEHPWHTDYTFPHKAALFSINTCDGYTEFEDGTKVESVENRMMVFNPCIKHRSTTTTNAMGRYNINFNYF